MMKNFLSVAKQGSMANQIQWLQKHGCQFWEVVCQMPLNTWFGVSDIPYDSLLDITEDQFRRRCSLVMNNVIAEYVSKGLKHPPIVRKGNRYLLTSASPE